MVVSRCRGIRSPSTGIVLGTLFLLAADLRRHPTSASLGLAESKIDYANLRHPSRRQLGNTPPRSTV